MRHHAPDPPTTSSPDSWATTPCCRRGIKEANYIYIDQTANWSKYTKIWLKPLELWKSDDPEAPLGKMSTETQQMLVDSFYAALYEALTNNFQIVDHGGPDVLVVHAAITDGGPPNRSLTSSPVSMSRLRW